MGIVWNWLLAPLRRVDSIPRIVAGLSLAARIALCVAVFQVLVVLLAIAVIVIGDERQVIDAWWQPGKLLVLAILLVLTPLVVHQAARLWLDRDVSPYQDILAAWRAALATLSMQGIDAAEVPLFLVFGSRSEDEEERLLGEASCEFTVSAAPHGDAALHVYGGPDAIFVCPATCSRLSDLVKHGRSTASTSLSNAPVVTNAELKGPGGTGPDDLRGTVMVGVATSPPLADARPGPDSPAPVPAAPQINPGVTIDISQTPLTTAWNQSSPPPTSTNSDRDRLRRRMTYLCSLLRQERAGLAPLNGVLALLPGDSLMSGGLDPQSVGGALNDDLRTLLAATGVRYPVVTLVLGLEREQGFVELIRRMPAAERANRLGRGFPAGAVASHSDLEALANRACGGVEDLVTGRLFRAADILSSGQNDRLATLLVRLRSTLADGLAKVLRRALVAPEGETSESAPFVAGCYLAACGTAADSRAFVRGVFDRFIDPQRGCQNDLEWMSRETDSDERAARWARGLWIVSGTVMTAVALLLVWLMTGKPS